MLSNSANIQVAVRVRPLSIKEQSRNSRIIIEHTESNQIRLINPKLEGSQSVHDHRDRVRQFAFDHCYLSLDRHDPRYATQQHIFDDVGADVLRSFMEGYNTCILCYGQTGTGKTFTMMGNNSTNEEVGLTPRICENLFQRIDSASAESASTLCFKTLISYVEIYNEKLHDLFESDVQQQQQQQQAQLALPRNNISSSSNVSSSTNGISGGNCTGAYGAKTPLRIREHPTRGIYVQHLHQHHVLDLKSTMRHLLKGNQNRATASTHVHDKSSRSHAIFTITFVQAKVENDIPVEIMSKLHLVDLAGSERAAPDLVYNKKQLKEGSNINKSLVSLGNVISILAENTHREAMNTNTVHSSMPSGLNTIYGRAKASGSSVNLHSMTESAGGVCGGASTANASNTGGGGGSHNGAGGSETKSIFVPYRDSILTHLLKDSLGGNSKTHMIANVSPSSLCYHDTLNTLLFAQRAKKIINRPKINEDPKTSLIKELKLEISKLRQLLVKTTSSLYPIRTNLHFQSLRLE